MSIAEDAASPIIEVRGLRTQFGAEVIHEALDFAVCHGEIVALVGGSATSVV